MSKDPSIPRRNKVNWHYVRDDYMFFTIKLVSRHQNTQQFGALLPIELTNEDIRNSNAYKEYYAVSTGATQPKPKASVQKTRSSFDTPVTPPTAAASPRLSTSAKGKQPAKASKAKRVLDVPTDEYVKEISLNSTNEEGDDDEGKDGDADDEGNGEENLGTNVGREEGQDEEDEAAELYRDININLGRGIQLGDVRTTQEVKDSHVTLIPRMNEAVKVAIQIQSDQLRDEAQEDNDEFLKTIDENMQKIIKEQVKEQVKIQVSKILLKIEQTVNEQLEAEKMEGNKSIHRSNEQRNLYKALVEAYESDKIILDTYGDPVTLKRRHDDDADKDEEPSAGLDWGSRRRSEGKEHESASAPKEKATRSIGKGASSRKYTTSVTKTKAADYEHIKWIEDLGRKRQQFYGFAINRESARDVYSKRRIIAVTELKIVEWHNYKHLDWITVRIDDDKLYKFKEGDFNRLRIQDIEDMIVIQRCVEDLQLGVESYQKKLNLTKPDTYHSDLKRKEAYISYSNPRGFIYQNKDKQNRLMRIDELHKFSDGTLTDVRTALDDRLKGIHMKYLPQSIWKKSDKDRAAAMI
nr:hypothetical protein [Tanacetum cinerariifolium]